VGALRSRLKPVLTVLVIFAVFAVLAWVRQRAAQPDLPPGSSYSNAPDGARAVLLWLEATGLRAGRLEGTQTIVQARPDALFVIQPGFDITSTGRLAFDDVANRGGTLVLAGYTPTLLEYAAELGVRSSLDGNIIETASPPRGTARLAGAPGASGGAASLTVPVRTRVRLQGAAGAQPLLVSSDGRVVALRQSYKRGTLIVLSTPEPLTNEGLRDPDTARFVYRELVAPLIAGPQGSPGIQPVVLFDETHHADPQLGLGPDASFATRLQRYVLTTPLGGAAVYAGALLFLYLLLSGRRLGPALRPVRAGAASRTMFEHVQALAGLYRRGAQFLPLRAHFSRHYRRLVARALGTAALLEGRVAPEALMERGLSPRRAQAVADAIAGIDAARGERQLGEAVKHADAAVEGLRVGTLRYPDRAAA